MELIKKLEKIIKYHTHQIIDENKNQWEVLELSDVKQAINDYKEKKQ